MKTLVSKILIIVFLVVLAHIAITYLLQDHRGYFAAIIDKHQILKNKESPKIVFVGGSNLAFSLDSEWIQNEFAQSVVNMGLHAGLGLRYMLEEIKPYINRQDLIIVVPEYSQFYTLLDGSQPLREIIIYPESIKYITSPRQFIILLQFHPISTRSQIYRSIRSIINNSPCDVSVYCRDSFNEYGDVVSHLDLDETSHNISSKPLVTQEPSAITTEAITALNNFYLYTEGIDVATFFLFPCVPNANYLVSKEYIDLLYDLLKNDMLIPMLNSPDECIFPTEYFFDSRYHLNAIGREIRTQRIINNLREETAISSRK